MTSPTLDMKITQMRTVKAERIVRSLQGDRFTPTDAARLSESARRAVERSAGVRIGSRETWQVAVDMLARSARVTCQFCGMGDPEGVVGPPQPYGHAGPCSK